MNKFYIYSLEEPKFSRDIARYKALKEKDSTLQLVAIGDKSDVLSEDFLKSVGEMLQLFAENGIRPHDIVFALDSKESSYSPAEWEQIKQVRAKLQQKGVGFGFEDYRQIWSLEDVEHANQQIDKSAEALRGKVFSPVEKLMSAYLEVTRRNYKFEDKTEHASQSRSVYGVLNSDKIVCVGFASLLKAILEKEGDKNIQIYENTVACTNDNQYVSAFHRNLIIYIKDPKYGLDGYYYVDPTWDCSRGDKLDFNLNHFLVPLKDIPHIKTGILDYNTEMRLAPKKPASKGVHTTKKTKKAIAKNKHTTYNRIAEGNNSFSRDGFAMSGKLTAQVQSNDAVMERLAEYLYISDELVAQLQLKAGEYEECFEQILEYFEENNIKQVPVELGRKFEAMIKKGASVEECIDYAYEVVSTVNFGVKAGDLDGFKNAFLTNFRAKLEDYKFVNSYKGMIELLRSDPNPVGEFVVTTIADYETKISDATAEIDAIIDYLSEQFDKDPEAMRQFVVNARLDAFVSNYDWLEAELGLLDDFSDQTLTEALQRVKNVMYVADTSSVFKAMGYTIDKQRVEKDRQIEDERRKIEGQMIVEALSEQSEPVSYDTISRVLTVVLSKNHPSATPQQIKEKVDAVMAYNARRSARCFTLGAQNAFYKIGSAIEQPHTDGRNS